MPFPTTTQVAYWLGVSENTVRKSVQQGILPEPLNCSGTSHYSADIILPLILEDTDVRFAGGLALRTTDGPIDFDVIRLDFKLDNFGKQVAVFQHRDRSWHVRPWKTAYVRMPYSLQLPDVILDCEDDHTPEIAYEDLPELQRIIGSSCSCGVDQVTSPDARWERPTVRMKSIGPMTKPIVDVIDTTLDREIPRDLISLEIQALPGAQAGRQDTGGLAISISRACTARMFEGANCRLKSSRTGQG